VDELRAQAVAAAQGGWDGVELVLQGEPADAAVTVPEVATPVWAVALRCSDTRAEAAATKVVAALPWTQHAGARTLNLQLPGLVGAGEETGFHRYADALNFLYDLLALLYVEAECSGVKLAVEAPAPGWLGSPVELRDLLDRVASGAVGVCVHAARLPSMPILEDWLLTLDRRAFAIRLSASSFAAGPTGINVKPVERLRAALDAADYRGLIIAGRAVPAAALAGGPGPSASVGGPGPLDLGD